MQLFLGCDTNLLEKCWMMTRIMTMKEISKDWFPSTIADELRLYVAKLLDKTLGSEIKFNHKLVIAHNIVDNNDNDQICI